MIHFSTTSESFLVICVHSEEISLAYVKKGTIYEKVQFKYSQVFQSNKSDYPPINKIWPAIKAYFDKVDDVLAFNLGVHRSHLREMLELHGISLPDKKYVCVYYWAQSVLGNTSLNTFHNLINSPIITDTRGDLKFNKDFVNQAVMVAKLALYLQTKDIRPGARLVRTFNAMIGV
ncbi:hypothetical protein [Telluribacter humicola]|uniref:hypothetical protein n=1 Tax=Telluribacter humicola TaxID=1720261 RepID=UPI001A96D0B9|nr:hypothetical protein [Telluribacter humicola]